MSRLLVFILTLGLLATTSLARADVEISKIGPYTVETGSWSAHLMRREASMQCPIGTSRDCYFVYLDVRNASDRILDCNSQLRWEDGAAAPSQRTSANVIGRRTSTVVILVNGGAKVNANLRYSVSCTARPEGTNPPPPTTPSGSVRMEGSPAYTVSTDRSQFTVSNTVVANRRTSGVSGALSLEIWFTTQKGGTSGSKVAQISLGTLQAQTGITVNRTVSIAPPNGTFYVAYVLLESGTQVDRVNFDPTIVVGGAVPQPPPPTPAGYLRIEGPGNISVSSDRTQLTVQQARVVNTRSSGISGSLILEVWFTSQPAGAQGIKAAQLSAGTILAGGSTTISQTVPISRPPSGTYYLVLVLREAGAEVDRMPLTGSFTVSEDARAPTASSSSGGGGRVDVAATALLILLGLGVRSKRRFAMQRVSAASALSVLSAPISRPAASAAGRRSRGRPRAWGRQ
jgi:hypothetical protein